MPPNNLDTHRQPFAGEATGNRDRWRAHYRNVITGLHPVDVSIHPGSFDFPRPMLGYIERQYLTDRKHKKLKALHETSHALIEFRIFSFGFFHIERAEAIALFDFPE